MPENIEMSGHLVKAGGQEGQKKKKTRFFTLGDEMMAYFDCKDVSKATIKKLKGTFPIEDNSKVETVGQVDGQAEGLPWKTGYAFEITSSGRTFKLYAGSQDDAKGWTRAVNTMIDYLGKRGSTAGAFSEQISRFAAACVGINSVLGDASDLTNATCDDAMKQITDTIKSTSDEIMLNLKDNNNRLDVLVARTREAIKGYDIQMKDAFDNTDYSSDAATQERRKLADQLEADKAIIQEAGEAIDGAQMTTQGIVARLQTNIRDKLAESLDMVVETMDEAQATAEGELVGIFNQLENDMNAVQTLGGGNAFAAGWWEDFQEQAGPLKELFDGVDQDSSGSITKDELKVAIMTSQEFQDSAELLGMADTDEFFTAIDLDNTETITYSEFVAFFSAASFVQFFVDADSDNSGSLSMLEFLKAIDESDDFDLSKYGMTAEQIFKEADEDGSDDLSFSEFAHAFKKLGLKED